MQLNEITMSARDIRIGDIVAGGEVTEVRQFWGEVWVYGTVFVDGRDVTIPLGHFNHGDTVTVGT